MAKNKRKKDSKKKGLKSKLLHKYRLVILNEDTFEERISFKLRRLNVFIFAGIFSIVLIALTTLLIAYTPLREYIPGYSSTTLRKKATNLMSKTDSLERELFINKQFLSSLQGVLKGDIKTPEIDKESIRKSVVSRTDTLDLSPIKADSLLRDFVATEEKYDLYQSAGSYKDFSLFTPVRGQITAGYNAAEKHFAVDIVTVKNAPVKAAADGTVIFAEWTAETGHVLILEHGSNLITVYKHNKSLNKSQGDIVQAGEVIATVGNTGTLTTGPHLHFEIWSDGYPVNPEDFIDFN